jgi:hypothetical protein
MGEYKDDSETPMKPHDFSMSPPALDLNDDPRKRLRAMMQTTTNFSFVELGTFRINGPVICLGEHPVSNRVHCEFVYDGLAWESLVGEHPVSNRVHCEFVYDGLAWESLVGYVVNDINETRLLFALTNLDPGVTTARWVCLFVCVCI